MADYAADAAFFGSEGTRGDAIKAMWERFLPSAQSLPCFFPESSCAQEQLLMEVDYYAFIDWSGVGRHQTIGTSCPRYLRDSERQPASFSDEGNQNVDFLAPKS